MSTTNNNLCRDPGHYQTQATTCANRTDGNGPEDLLLYSDTVKSRNGQNTPSSEEGSNDTLKHYPEIEPDNHSAIDASGCDENANLWIVVGPCYRAKSLDSSKNVNKYTLKPIYRCTHMTSQQAKKPVKLTTAQGAAIREAEKNLSQAHSSDELVSSHGEGPSRDKGKGPDPKNWGDVQPSESDIDIDQQQKALEDFKTVHNAHPNKDKDANRLAPEQPNQVKKNTLRHQKTKGTKLCAGSEALTDQVESHIRDLIEEHPRQAWNTDRCQLQNNSAIHIMWPSQMLAPTNYLSKLLTPAKNSDSKSSSSSSSDSSSDSDNHHHCHHQQKSHKKYRKMLLKPDPPEVYDGSANKGLWQEKLNPEISSYDEIASAAELVKIIENVDPEDNSKGKSDKSEKSKNSGNSGQTLSNYKGKKSQINQSFNQKKELTQQNNGESSKNHSGNFKNRSHGKFYRKEKNQKQCKELTDKEKEEYYAEGHIDIPIDNNQLWELAKTTEEITELNFGMMEIEPNEMSDTSTHASMLSLKSGQLTIQNTCLQRSEIHIQDLGCIDPMTIITLEMSGILFQDELVMSAPYPTDTQPQKICVGRFSVYRVAENQYCINDSEYIDASNWKTKNVEWVYVIQDQLESPTFRLPYWPLQNSLMQDTYALAIEKWLDRIESPHNYEGNYEKFMLPLEYMCNYRFDLTCCENLREHIYLLNCQIDHLLLEWRTHYSFETNGIQVPQDQLGIQKIELTKLLPLQLAVQGSRSKINWGVKAQFQYQEILKQRYFDIANLSSYDIILGTPFLFQHKVMAGFNDSRIIIGSNESLPIQGDSVSKLSSRATDLFQDHIDSVQKELVEYAKPLCKSMADTDLPPLRAINHTIPLIDKVKILPWRPSRCPEKFRTQWAKK
ncbi:hypothetical protein GYMLUDRAFT_58474 [Collybiopsis luxurians FD-317 M1]|uniref:Uncharacterized protein n=1 Tax=Collybiopsis luxurians FD-317 M1 TaxID=944289 RepID=A0A0D0C2G6_9AGAR|nr:hypothetical protein GYMLUDRAFT_58474 [Collybiopsis luxurians FD-317 M1]